MRFDHLALAVRDPDRSLFFYTDVLGLTGTTRREDDGLLLTTPEGFILALLDGEPPQLAAPFHFGISASTPEEVRAARHRLQARGVEETEWADEAEYVSTKVRDPDGYVVEISWEPGDRPTTA
jgi:catechol 2,3-dioxygenase-like lactoylglutathione lyase family enzyme